MDHRDPPGSGAKQPPPPLWPTASGARYPSPSGAAGHEPPDPTPDDDDLGAEGEPGADVDRDVAPEDDDAGVTGTPATGTHATGTDATEAGASGADGVGPRRRRRVSDDTRHGSGGGAAAFFRELPVLILVAFVLAFLLRTFVVQVFFIPSSSMEPTLQVDDRMVVEKITFRFREPRRGDIVVFEEEGESLVSPTRSDQLLRGVGQFLGLVPVDARDFVKRVIAVGDDEVRIEGGEVLVNDVPLEEPYVVFPDGDDYGPVTVPDEHLFFLGDNRPNSSDSRRSLGFVPADAVVGRAVVVIWPLEHWDSLTGVVHELEDPDAG